MAFLLEIKPSAEKSLERLPEQARLKIKVILFQIQNNPWMGKKLKGKYAGSYSVKVWPYRIIYDIYKHDLLIMVIRIKHWGQAYD
jgi:mRNA-degrading endonuclease RelE of RelBE toxin-antitoxin system